MQENNQPPSEHRSGAPGLSKQLPGNFSLLLELALPVRIRLGQVTMRLGEALQLRPGSLVEIGNLPDGLVELLVNDRVVARGELVVVENNLGMRVNTVVRGSEQIGFPGATPAPDSLN